MHSAGHQQHRAPTAQGANSAGHQDGMGSGQKREGEWAQVAVQDEIESWGHENRQGGRKKHIVAQDLTGRVCPGYGEWVGRGRKYGLALNRVWVHVAMDDGDLSNLPLFPPSKTPLTLLITPHITQHSPRGSPICQGWCQNENVGLCSKILSAGKTICMRENLGRVGGRHPNGQSKLARGWKEGHLLPEETGKGQDVVRLKA